jgi:hypothetical protein
MVSLPHLNTPFPEGDNHLPFFHSLSHGSVIRCEIIFGSPSMDCRGTGICKIISTEELTDNARACTRFPVSVALRPDEKGLLFLFSKDLLSDTAFSRHFQNGMLTMNGACPVPEFIRSGLKTDIQYLSQGCYQLLRDDEYVFLQVDTEREVVKPD